MVHRPRVVLADSSEVLLRGFELLFTARDLHVVAAATTEVEALAIIDRAEVDVLAVSLTFGDSPVRSVRLLNQRAPMLPILVYGGRGAWPLQQLLDAGIRGCVVTTGPAAAFTDVVRSVAQGATYLDPELELGGVNGHEPLAQLSARERQIVVLLAHGLTGSEVAARLFLSPTTVRTHVQNAMHKLGARTRAHAIAIAAGSADALPARNGTRA